MSCLRFSDVYFRLNRFKNPLSSRWSLTQSSNLAFELRTSCRKRLRLLALSFDSRAKVPDALPIAVPRNRLRCARVDWAACAWWANKFSVLMLCMGASSKHRTSGHSRFLFARSEAVTSPAARKKCCTYDLNSGSFAWPKTISRSRAPRSQNACNAADFSSPNKVWSSLRVPVKSPSSRVSILRKCLQYMSMVASR